MRFAPPRGVPPVRTVLFFAWTRFDPIEADFWQRLDVALAARHLRLILAGPADPPAGFPVATITVPRWLDDLSPVDCDRLGAIDVAALGLDETALLAREEEWTGPALTPAVEDGRRLAMAAVASFWARTLSALGPSAVVIWNGEHVPEIVLEALCRLGGCPTLVAERGPIPRTLFIDEEGLLTASRIARDAWPAPDGPWRRAADRAIARLAQGHLTAWEQPPSLDGGDLRAAIGARPDQTVALFAGQVDGDTQRFLFSPHFPDNLSAFRAFVDALRGREDVFVLGKQHPYSQTPVSAYAAILAERGVSGTWRADVALDDALAIAQRVAAVNSTVLHEGLARGKPALVLGEWLLSGRSAATEIASAGDVPAAVLRWLDGADATRQQEAWRDGLAFLLATSLYALEPPMVAEGLASADELAERVARRAGAEPWRAPDSLLAHLLPGATTLGAGWWDDGTSATARSDRRAIHERLESANEGWRLGMIRRHSLLRAWAAAGDGRAVVIWGTGRAAQLATDLLGSIGIRPDAYTQSKAEPGGEFAGRPVVQPSTLPGSCAPRPFVVVASSVHAEITPELVALGFSAADDFVVLDGHALARLESRSAAASA